ncbi:NifB/NifX family molybdenum-iron cluster-binding protein [Vibrio sp.]|uniref:Nitrogen fixation protein NifX n=1 Tax=Vibrio viridaestus TaxID=2487322 RepID=A0A3N9TEH2_9VIBR|nr:NifB/NifX family molybdenum-iron cluster-binding protein [Vibrio viridaestus]MDC0610990.1 NifB/NifX family molybdenum-iron cluster-binding protein [Vibrio sp.]RQW62103.1 nitrogen fixation protein NifX [Vibrio viridaestus]
MKISERRLHVELCPGTDNFSLKVAFATLDRKSVDQHFGSCRTMLVYGVNAQEWNLIEAIEYAEVPASTHDKLPTRISDLTGCDAVFCNACGASAIRQLLEKNIHPVKVIEGSDIHELLVDIQSELNGEPSGWLARAIKQREKETEPEVKKAERLSQLMDEEW